MNPTAILRQIRIGQPQPFARGQVSAIDRQPAHGTVEVLADTLAGDSVGDTRFHGGADKAVHCYTLANYDYWRFIPTIHVSRPAASAKICALKVQTKPMSAWAIFGKSARRASK